MTTAMTITANQNTTDAAGHQPQALRTDTDAWSDLSADNIDAFMLNAFKALQRKHAPPARRTASDSPASTGA